MRLPDENSSSLLTKAPAKVAQELSPQENKLIEIREKLLNQMPWLRPRNELTDLVSRKSQPTSRARFYPEILAESVDNWLRSEKVQERALKGEALSVAEFHQWFELNPPKQNLWTQYVTSRLSPGEQSRQ